MNTDYEQVFDEIGPWSEVKLDIIREYASAYSVILAKPGYFHHVYIDAFAGLGYHKSKTTQEFVNGSPRIAVEIDPPFKEYFFVDINRLKISSLEELKKSRPGTVHVEEGDCNELLVRDILPKVKKDKYWRALCLLDPYGLHLDWSVIELAGKLQTVEIFLNFPIMDMNMNILKRNRDAVDPKQEERMNSFWGDDSWKEAAYTTEQNLFGWEEKDSNEALVRAFCNRLETVAGFGYVATPLPMKNSKKATVYYLFFASPNKTGGKIGYQIFQKYR